MVHYQQFSDAKWSHSGDYWMLEKPRSSAAARRYLDDRGASYLKNSAIERLQVLCGRVQRGLPIYDKIDIQTLQQSCNARGLPSGGTTGTVKRRKEILIERLEAADDSLTFDRFLDLPPELRLEVYGFYFSDVINSLKPAGWGGYRQPPITTLDRISRKEALDEFYKVMPFELIVGTGQSGPRAQGAVWQTVMSKQYFAQGSVFLERAPRESVDRLQVLKISGNVWIRRGEGKVRCEIIVDFKVGNAVGRLGMGDGDFLGDLSAESAQQVLDARLATFVEVRKRAGGKLRLQRDDADAIKELLKPID
ncbi:hypothetical protein AC579_9792 [Pseudocercospora musae]|uniref:Uncharacterized protein n=1 Tax=Pseudocercospora musae TaxID=113226 RepID=A0A139IVJ2_9PEZI|nr:hypothetical protein AC579_9792 [Pseudocercospora musae]